MPPEALGARDDSENQEASREVTSESAADAREAASDAVQRMNAQLQRNAAKLFAENADYNPSNARSEGMVQVASLREEDRQLIDRQRELALGLHEEPKGGSALDFIAQQIEAELTDPSRMRKLIEKYGDPETKDDQLQLVTQWERTQVNERRNAMGIAAKQEWFKIGLTGIEVTKKF